MSDFSKNSVLHGMKIGEFRNLDKMTRVKLLKIISRISESSYRRGFQHGKEIDERRPTVDPYTFRFRAGSLDHSPLTDTFHENGKWAKKSGMSSLDRLRAEHDDLVLVGLDCDCTERLR